MYNYTTLRRTFFVQKKYFFFDILSYLAAIIILWIRDFTLSRHCSCLCNDMAPSSQTLKMWPFYCNVSLQQCVQPSLSSGRAGPVMAGSPSEAPGPGGGRSSRPQGSRVSWVSLPPFQLSGCLLSVAHQGATQPG